MIALIIKKILKILKITFVSILSLVLLLLVCFYLPPVQQRLKKLLCDYVQTEMGITMEVEQLRIAFPLDLTIQGVTAYTPSDTLLVADDITIDVGLSQLLLGRLRGDYIHLGGVHLDTDGLIEGIHIQGTVNALSLQAKRWDLKESYLLINNAHLKGADISLSLADTTATEPDTASAPFLRKIKLITGKVEQVNVAFEMPLDSLRLFANVRTLDLKQVSVNLERKQYEVGNAHLQTDQFLLAMTNKAPLKDSTRIEIQNGDLQINRVYVAPDSEEYKLSKLHLKSGLLTYDAFAGKPEKGLDPNHIQLRNVELDADSLRMYGKEYWAVIRAMSLQERSGLTLTSLSGRVNVDDAKQMHAQLKASTPYSSASFQGNLSVGLLDSVPKGEIAVRLQAQLGKPDLMIFGGDLPRSFQVAYPNRSLLIQGEVSGNEKQIRLKQVNAVLPGAFSVKANGMYGIPHEDLQLQAEVKGENLNFLTALAGSAPDSSLIIPHNILLVSKVTGKGSRYETTTSLRESVSTVSIHALYDTKNESYSGLLRIDSLQPMHFLPQDSILGVSASLKFDGKGTDIYSSRTHMDAVLEINRIEFPRGYLRGIAATATLKNKEAEVLLSCDNPILNMDGELKMHLDKVAPVGTLGLNIWKADLQQIGVVGNNMKDPFTLVLDAEVNKEETSVDLQTGDMELSLESKVHFTKLIDESLDFIQLLTKQLKEHMPNQQELRKVLPVARVQFTAGRNNVLNHILQEETGVSFNASKLTLDASPEGGLRGGGYLYGLHTSDIELDTLLLGARQDSSDMKLHAKLINGPHNEFYTFTAQINTVIRNDNGDLVLKVVDKNGEIAADLGVRGTMEEKGFLFTLFPENPVVAFQKMRLNKDNRIKLHDSGRIEANLRMDDSDSGMSISVLSNDTAVNAKQDLRITMENIDVGDVIRAFPFLPDIDGLFSGNIHIAEYKKLRFTLQSELKGGKYNGMLLGDLGLRAAYAPDSLFNRHIIGAQLTRNGDRVVSVGGNYQSETGELTHGIANLHGFPLSLIDGFVPEQMVRMQGKAQGKIEASGTLSNLKINGSMRLDSATAEVPMANLTLRFEEKDLIIEDNQLRFDKYSIYAAGKEPFVITGNVDFRNMEHPSADLKLTAENYTLIDNSRRTRNTELFGRLAVTLNSTVKGPLDRLQMRGNMRILGNTNLTYIMKDSPLDVQDRLSEQVTFINFADSLQTDSLADATVYRPSSIDMMLNLAIDPAVRVRAELSADGTNYVDLEGGGSLVLKGDPQHDLSLTGRYTLNSGTMKYAFSMIPLKEFTITNGSYVQWNGNLMNPMLQITATEVIRSSVGDSDGNSRQVNFNISVILSNTLENLGVAFDISSPEDMTMQNELTALTSEERSKQAITTLATGVYMGGNSSSKGLTVSDALNSLLQSEINSLAGNVLSNTDISIGMNRYSSSTGGEQSTSTDYSYKVAKRLWNNRVRVVIGGTITQGNDANARSGESFIENISIEYNIDKAGTRSVRVYHNKDYESLLEGEIVETGVGFVYRKKYNRWFEIFPWVKKKTREPVLKKDTE